MGYLQYLPIDRFANFVWWMLTRERSKEDIDKLNAQLWQPEKGEVVTDPRSPWSPEAEGNAFAALKNSMGGASKVE